MVVPGAQVTFLRWQGKTLDELIVIMIVLWLLLIMIIMIKFMANKQEKINNRDVLFQIH